MRLISCVLEFLFPSRAPERLVRDATPASVGAHLCPTSYADSIVTLLPYRVPLVRALVLEAKFRDNGQAQRLLGAVLADYLRAWLEERASFADGAVVFVPIPLSDARLKERGYNQCERIAKEALGTVQEMQLASGMLRRVRDTAPQTSLDGTARRENVIGAFEASGVDPVHTYIVFDDVLTTGSTLVEAMQALENAGAARVLGLSLAH